MFNEVFKMDKRTKLEQEIIDNFWIEYSAYALNDFKKNGYYYNIKPLESAILRIVGRYIIEKGCENLTKHNNDFKKDSFLSCGDCKHYPNDCKNYAHRKMYACSEYEENPSLNHKIIGNR